MSAVSKKVTPAPSAASTTARVASSSIRPPKLLQPSPTTVTSSGPSFRVRIDLKLAVASRLMRYFEDFKVGDVTEVGPVTVSAEEIVDFASRFDPQPFHIDPEAAKSSSFGGLIASGWHTTALFMGMFVRGILLDSASLGSPGVEEIRWTAPVRPGDQLTGRITVTDVQPSSKNPSRGTVFTTSEVFNQDGTLVMSLKARGFFARPGSLK